MESKKFTPSAKMAQTNRGILYAVQSKPFFTSFFWGDKSGNIENLSNPNEWKNLGEKLSEKIDPKNPAFEKIMRAACEIAYVIYHKLPVKKTVLGTVEQRKAIADLAYNENIFYRAQKEKKWLEEKIAELQSRIDENQKNLDDSKRRKEGAEKQVQKFIAEKTEESTGTLADAIPETLKAQASA